MKDLAGKPALLGYRMPAEWETHEQTWIGWPVKLFLKEKPREVQISCREKERSILYCKKICKFSLDWHMK